MTKITNKQKQILIFIVGQKDNGPVPTYSEIARHFDISVPTVKAHVDALVSKGILNRADRKARALSLTSKGHSFLSSTETAVPNKNLSYDLPRDYIDSKLYFQVGSNKLHSDMKNDTFELEIDENQKNEGYLVEI